MLIEDMYVTGSVRMCQISDLINMRERPFCVHISFY